MWCVQRALYLPLLTLLTWTLADACTLCVQLDKVSHATERCVTIAVGSHAALLTPSYNTFTVEHSVECDFLPLTAMSSAGTDSSSSIHCDLWRRYRQTGIRRIEVKLSTRGSGDNSKGAKEQLAEVTIWTKSHGVVCTHSPLMLSRVCTRPLLMLSHVSS